MKKFKLMLLVSMLFLLLTGCADPWPESGLLSILPDPNAKKWELCYELEDSASAILLKATQSSYDSYITQIEEAGFTMDVRSTENTYQAFNEDGYQIHLHFFGLKKQIEIVLYAPVENNPITWPSTGLGALLPVPPSATGEIRLDSESMFCVSVTNISEEEFTEYANACIANGFENVSGLNEILLSAYNEDHVTLTVDYSGFNTMNITVSGYFSTAE
ncbi:MAG: hypothetical protein E7285_10225 [Lachnospiraceae bacterium]|nr:hypothetical protein [Lachnospiraceae bacterium]